MDDRESLLYRHALMRAEIRLRLSASGKWTGLPGLLDELHQLRIELLERAPQQPAVPPAEPARRRQSVSGQRAWALLAVGPSLAHTPLRSGL